MPGFGVPRRLQGLLLAARLGDADLRFAIGYHGTSVAALERIRTEGFRLSRKWWEWLGDGIYFFQDGPEHAREWALRKHPSEPAVVRALLVWHRDRALDFLDTASAEEVSRRFQESLDRTGLPPLRQEPGSKLRPLDCGLINLVVAELEAESRPVHVVRAPFPEDEPIVPNSAITERGHVQIAVRDPAVIKRIWFQWRL